MFKTRLLQLLIKISPVFDWLSGPSLAQAIWRRLLDTRLLTDEELAAARAVLGSAALQYDRVRVCSGGFLEYIFERNASRAFTTFHTLNLPQGTKLEIVVHELAHVCQYERVGTRYMFEALLAQIELGGEAYNYGGAKGLLEDFRAQKHYAAFNREQQAQIIQDYYRWKFEAKGQLDEEQSQAYQAYLGDLLSGRV